MSLACVELHDTFEIVKDRQKVETLREILPHLPELKFNESGEPVDKWDFRRNIEELVIDLLETGPLLVAAGFKFTVRSFRNNQLISLNSRLESLTSEMKLVRRMVYNPETQIVAQVHIPNGFLHEVNEIKVLDDTCTDVLQGELDEGWRILAVCPSIDQRRPDYILGRFNQSRVLGSTR